MASNRLRMRARKQRAARLSHFYFPFKPPGYWMETACCYCGNASKERDHIPPFVWLEALGPSYFDDAGIPIVWIPSCKECNGALSDKKMFTIRERTGFLIDYYTKKHATLATSPIWTTEELDDLGPRLRQGIEHWSIRQLALDRRLKILEENYSVRSMR